MKKTLQITLTAGLCLTSIYTHTTIAADVVSTWRGFNGNWGVAANWTNTPPVNFPNNGNGGFTYDAVVGSGTVTLDQDITIESLTLTCGSIRIITLP